MLRVGLRHLTAVLLLPAAGACFTPAPRETAPGTVPASLFLARSPVVSLRAGAPVSQPKPKPGATSATPGTISQNYISSIFGRIRPASFIRKTVPLRPQIVSRRPGLSQPGATWRTLFSRKTLWLASGASGIGALIAFVFLMRFRRRRSVPVFLGREWADHPRFMIMGADGSGKSSLVQSLARQLPRTGSGPDHLLQGNYRWWFFDDAVILDPDGSLVLDRSGVGSDGTGWNNLLRSLRNDRPDRPLDGVILNLSMEDLTVDEELPGTEAGEVFAGEAVEAATVEEKARQRAVLFKEKLKSLENVLGMRLPVYLVVGKSDLLPEFQSLCESLPARLLNSSLGWSNPYSLESVHGPERTDEALQELGRRMHSLQLERFAEENPVQGAEDFFLLPHRLRPVFRVLSIYINTIFRESIHQESFFFRGLYFAGTRLVGSIVRPDSIERRVAFVKDLFQKKIFTEWTLARPIQRTLLSRNRTVFWIQVGILVFALVSGIGLYANYRELRETRQPIREAILQVAQGLRRLPYSSGVFNEFAGDLFRDMARIPRDNLFFLFIPSSWFSSIDEEIVGVFKQGYHHLIVRALRAGLLQRSAALLECYQPGLKTLTPGCDLPLAAPRPTARLAGKGTTPGIAKGDLKKAEKDLKALKNPKGAAKKAAKKAAAEKKNPPAPEKPEDKGDAAVAAKKPAKTLVIPITAKKSPAFERLVKFTRALDLLETNIARFNLLQESGEDDLVQLKLLANYLGYDIPRSFLESEDLYRKALKKAEGEKINQAMIVFQWDESLREYFSEEEIHRLQALGRTFPGRGAFLKAVRDALRRPGGQGRSGKHFSDFRKQIEPLLLKHTRSFEDGAVGTARGLMADVYAEQIRDGVIGPLAAIPDLDRMQKSNDPARSRDLLNEAVLKADASLQKLNPVWIRGGAFVAYPDFAYSLERLSASRFAGPKVADAVRKSYEDERMSSRAFLETFRLWDVVPVMQTVETEDQRQVLASPLSFSSCMAAFRDAAVERKPDKELPSEVRPFARLIWKAAVLKKAGKLYTSHEEFIARELDRCPPEARFMLRRLAESNLRARILNTVAGAVVYEPFPRRAADLLEEKEIARESKSLAQAAEDLENLLSVLENMDDPTLFRLVLSQSDRLFRSLDRLLVSVSYVPGREYFSRWDGQQSLTFTVYDLDGEPEIEAFLKLQRATMAKLAGYAAPAADLLEYRVNQAERRELRRRLRSYRGWRRIIDDLESYETRTPGNPVSTMEKFIMYEMDEITGSNCYQKTADRNRHEEDYFLERIGIIKRYIHARCEKLYVN